MPNRRRSARLVPKNVAAPPSPRKKFKEISEDSEEGCIEAFERFSIDDENITKEDITQPTVQYQSHDVAGEDIYGIKKSPKKNKMIEIAKKARDKPQNIIIENNKKSPKVLLQNTKSCENIIEKLKNESSKKAESNQKNLICPSRLRSGKTRNTGIYQLNPDNYFEVQSEKSKTSSNTLSQLKNQKLDQQTLKKLLEKSDHIPDEHKRIIQDLSNSLEQSFIEWIQIMEEGFSVLLYGLGSKRMLINQFQKTMINMEPALIINGFFPSLTLKEILDNIIEELMEEKTATNENECFRIIEEKMLEYPNECIYLLIHNIDGSMLRGNKVQDTLSRLAAIPNIHLLASVDHINAPLIWDNVMRSRFNFYWVDATTFLPYEAETSYESSLLIKQSGTLALQSLQSVFASLTKNAKLIYIHLAKFQLENSKNNYNGMPFKDLYRASREKFWVSTDALLRAQLTEFLDHKLVKTKRHSDGVEYLIIPMEDGILRQFLEQYNTEG